MNKKSIMTAAACLCLALSAALPGCNAQEGKTEGADEAEATRIQQMDSVESHISQSAERLEEKAKELEAAMQELDTTTLNK